MNKNVRGKRADNPSSGIEKCIKRHTTIVYFAVDAT
jgi:hypothetical protein